MGLPIRVARFVDLACGRGAWSRLRASLWPLVQTAVAASLAWLIAARLLGHRGPLFAPIAAIVSLAATRGQRSRRAADLTAAEQAQLKARRVSGDWARFEQALDVGREAARYAPTRRRQRDGFVTYREVGLPLDLLVRDVHVLARGAVRALTIGDPVPSHLIEALRDLARATQGLAGRLARHDEGEAVQSTALRAASTATKPASADDNISIGVLIGYTQATAADVLRALGIDRRRAHASVGEAVQAARS